MEHGPGLRSVPPRQSALAPARGHVPTGGRTRKPRNIARVLVTPVGTEAAGSGSHTGSHRSWRACRRRVPRAGSYCSPCPTCKTALVAETGACRPTRNRHRNSFAAARSWLPWSRTHAPGSPRVPWPHSGARATRRRRVVGPGGIQAGGEGVGERTACRNAAGTVELRHTGRPHDAIQVIVLEEGGDGIARLAEVAIFVVLTRPGLARRGYRRSAEGGYWFICASAGGARRHTPKIVSAEAASSREKAGGSRATAREFSRVRSRTRSVLSI